jgi:hypothetical protein
VSSPLFFEVYGLLHTSHYLYTKLIQLRNYLVARHESNTATALSSSAFSSATAAAAAAAAAAIGVIRLWRVPPDDDNDAAIASARAAPGLSVPFRQLDPQ